MCPYLVGSYEQVAEELARYIGAGYRTVILDIPPSEDELAHTFAAFGGRSNRCDDAARLQTGSRGRLTQARRRLPSRGRDATDYAELDTLSTQLATLLVEGGCRRGDRVALLIPKSVMADHRPARHLQGGRDLRAARPVEPCQPPGEDSRQLAKTDGCWPPAPSAPLLDELCRNRRKPAVPVNRWLGSCPPR